MIGYIFQNENETYQGPFCDEVDNAEHASIHDRLNRFDTTKIHKIVKVEYEWKVGKKILLGVVD